LQQNNNLICLGGRKAMVDNQNSKHSLSNNQFSQHTNIIKITLRQLKTKENITKKKYQKYYLL